MLGCLKSGRAYWRHAGRGREIEVFDSLIAALEMLTIALGIELTEDLIAGPLLTVPIPAQLAATT